MSATATSLTQTILEALVSSLESAAVYNRSAMVAPAAILWPDEHREWEALMPLLREVNPYLLTLGPWDPASRTGPAIWLKCKIGRTLSGEKWPDDAVPVLYLPGVSRQMLRAVKSCPKHLQPLAELQYRGVFWTQQNTRDWTILAFLKSNGGGLALDVAQDGATLAAMKGALLKLADTPVETLRGRRLEAVDFHQLLSPDPARDLLRWLNDPDATRKQWGSDHWQAFRSLCKTQYDFDPQADGELVGAEHLAMRQGAWDSLWVRFAEAPWTYKKLPDLLHRAEHSAPSLFHNAETWPGANAEEELGLRESLAGLKNLSPHDVAEKLEEIEKRHGVRRDYVWATIGNAPLARALEHLARLAIVCSKPVGGSTIEEMGTAYTQDAWRADAAVLDALACVERGEDLAAVKASIRSLYGPWLADSATHLQDLVRTGNVPGQGADAQPPAVAEPGECILFADGLRFDVGHRLAEALTRHGFEAPLHTRWTGLPSVTATSKPAVSPVAPRLKGLPDDDNFQPSVAETGEDLSTHRFRKLLEDEGYEYIPREDVGEPSGKGWTEHGELDQTGHEHGWKLAWRISEEVRGLVERIETLIQAGWKRVKVVTDHGWLLLPGGLPKIQLPGFLAATRWGRCAVLKSSATAAVQVVPWRWSNEVQIALAPGTSCFVAGKEYAHGGLSLQECLTPVLVVSRTPGAPSVVIREVSWRGLRCRATVEGATEGLLADLRTKPADGSTSLSTGPKPLDAEGKASLLVPDDAHMGMAAFFVVVNGEGTVLAKSTTCVGGGD